VTIVGCEKMAAVGNDTPTSNTSTHVSNPIVIGCPTEVKQHENRVGLTPAAAREFAKRGHKVIVQSGAGCGSGFEDDAYFKAGCQIIPTAKEVFDAADMIVKVKEPLPQEYDLIREGQIVYTYFHFAANEALTEAMIKSKAICVAYETISKDGALPLLLPMSEVAGRMAVQEGAKYLEKAMGGLGILLGGVPGVRPAKVLVIGGGVVGTNAARVAAGMGADVVVLDVNLTRLRQLDDIMPKNVRMLYNTEQTVLEELRTADVVIGAVLIPGAKCPRIVRKEHLKMMKKGSVVIDVAVDQGGCIETCRPTTHDEPTYVVDGVVHYCVANMPGAVPFTSTVALSNATLRYGLSLAEMGWKGACGQFPELRSGMNVVEGKVTYQGVAEAFDKEYTDVNTLLGDDVVETIERRNRINSRLLVK